MRADSEYVHVAHPRTFDRVAAKPVATLVGRYRVRWRSRHRSKMLASEPNAIGERAEL